MFKRLKHRNDQLVTVRMRKLTVKRLKEYAREHGCSGCSKLNERELLALLA